MVAKLTQQSAQLDDKKPHPTASAKSSWQAFLTAKLYLPCTFEAQVELHDQIAHCTQFA
jgi:hypothetical protein